MMTQICTRCIYDETIPYITFDDEGICDYCHRQDRLELEYPTGEAGLRKLNEIVKQIKKEGRNKPYDVVVGLSGGCDSSYMLYLAKKMGLRPLAAHFDNTWNSKIAVENIKTMLDKLDVDLFTYVVESKEYNDIFKSFFKAGVPEIDIPTDLSLMTTIYMAAEKYKIKYYWLGHSFRTEGITPVGWVYMDAKYIQTIQQTYGSYKLKSLPNLWLRKWFKWMLIDRIKGIRPLYYIDYNKDEVKEFLSKEFGWQWYGGHHMENRTSYFANNYFLPKKFKIDLRLCEFAALVRSGQMERDVALQKIKEPMPFDDDILDEIMKRLDITFEEFETYMNQPNKSFRDYKTYKKTFEKLKPFFWLMYKFHMVPKSFYLKFATKFD